METRTNIFETIVSAEAVAEIATENLRYAMVNTVIVNTAAKHRINEKFYEILTTEADKFIAATTIKLFVDNESYRTYSFIGKNNIEKLDELQKLFNTLVGYEVSYEDADGFNVEEFNEEVRYSGFCWNYNGRKYSLVVKEVNDEEDRW